MLRNHLAIIWATYNSLSSTEVSSTTCISAKKEQDRICVTVVFRRDADETCALLGYYAAQSGLQMGSTLTLEGGTDRHSRNVGTELPLYAV
jgi:hypothetical protein